LQKARVTWVLTFQCPGLFKAVLIFIRVHRDNQKSKDDNTGKLHDELQQRGVKKSCLIIWNGKEKKNAFE